jgi:hypothetical protein
MQQVPSASSMDLTPKRAIVCRMNTCAYVCLRGRIRCQQLLWLCREACENVDVGVALPLFAGGRLKEDQNDGQAI